MRRRHWQSVDTLFMRRASQTLLTEIDQRQAAASAPARSRVSARSLAVALPLVVGLLAALYAWNVQRGPSHLLIDFSQNYAAAQFLREGRNPYVLIGPTGEFHWQWPLFYPLTTAVAVLPFTLLSVSVAPIVFAAIGAALFAVALQRHEGVSRWRYLTLLSKPFLVAVATGQSSCYLASAFVLAPVAALAAIKPNVGAAVLAGRFDRRGLLWAAIGGALLVGVSLAMMPGWIPEWLSAVKSDPFRMPAIGRPGGFLLVLSLLRWRRPDARLLFALSIVPQTLFIYDALPLLFIPRRASEAIALVVLSHFGWLMAMNQASAGVNDQIVVVGNWVVWSLFLPSLFLVMIRPNEAPSPGQFADDERA